MINKPLPFFLEDRTGLHAESDFDDIYDRMFLRVGRPSGKSLDLVSAAAVDDAGMTLGIYNVGRRSSNQRDYRSFQREPAVLLQFGPAASLGKITFMGSATTMSMNQYLKKTAMFGG